MRQLFLDLEGKGGSAAPSLDPFFPEIPDSAREHYSKLRTECVNETLPRLAYLLSDVVIWIAGGEKANSNNFKESLELLTKSCIRNVRAAASKELQPALILVMNKRQLVDVTAKGTKVLLPDDAIAERSASFFGGDNPMTELKESLDTIFSKVLVFDLPDWSSVYMDPDDADAEEIRGIDVFLNRFKHLKKAIQQAIADRQMERAASENLVLQSHVWLAMMQEV